MNADMILATIESLDTTKSELETLLTLHLMEAKKKIPLLVYYLQERMDKIKTAIEHPTDFPSIISTYSDHMADFNRQLVALERLVARVGALSVNNEIIVFKEFYLNQKNKK